MSGGRDRTCVWPSPPARAKRLHPPESGRFMHILFLFIGEPHQLLHALPIAAEMADMGVMPQVAVASAAHLRMVEKVTSAYPGFCPPVTLLGRRGPAQWLRTLHVSRNPRLPTLLGALPWLRRF